jgi:hypothetical protein
VKALRATAVFSWHDAIGKVTASTSDAPRAKLTILKYSVTQLAPSAPVIKLRNPSTSSSATKPVLAALETLAFAATISDPSAMFADPVCSLLGVGLFKANHRVELIRTSILSFSLRACPIGPAIQ